MQLEETNWQGVTDSYNVDKPWLCFKIEFLTIIDKIAPFKLVRLKHGTAPGLPMNYSNLFMTGTTPRNNTKKKTHFAALHGKNISFRNRAQNLKTQLKTNYFSTQLEENQKNHKMLWQILKSLGTCKS